MKPNILAEDTIIEMEFYNALKDKQHFYGNSEIFYLKLDTPTGASEALIDNLRSMLYFEPVDS